MISKYGIDPISGSFGLMTSPDVADDVEQTNVVSATSEITISRNKMVIKAVGTFSVQLAAATKKWRTTVLNKGDGAVTLLPAGDDTIEGSTALVLSKKYQHVSLVGDGEDTYFQD